MKEPMSESAGSFLREHLDGELDGPEYVEARSRFVEAALASKEPKRGATVLWGALAMGFAAATLVAFLVFHSTRAPLTFSVGPSRSAGTVSEYIASPSGDEVPLYFSDGSVVTLAPTARARVDHTTARGAAVFVEAGTLSANIVHRAGTDWTFFAGPYSVRVTGTAFVLLWDSTGTLDIRMKAGAVVVHGPGATQGVEVRDHARFSSPAPVASAPLEPQNRGTPEAPGTAPSPPGDRTATVGPASAGSSVTNRMSAAAGSAAGPESWATLVARGEYSRVLDLAERRGIEATLAGASLEDLGALSDAARFQRTTSLAERTLEQIRTRFPTAARAHAAAFLLGRLADDAGNTAAAVGWYDRYLSEAPGGPLAAEALGRRMLSRRRLNDPESAARAAREYLEKYPSGPYARVARDIAGL